MPNANRDKGLRAERAVAQYFIGEGLLDAKRSVATGWRNGKTSSADEGDVKGVPGVCVQVKSYAKPLAGKALDDATAQTAEQCEAGHNALPLLIEKRAGHASPGEWWAHLPANILAGLMFGVDPYADKAAWLSAPCRIELKHIMPSLVRFSQHYARQQSA
jgi:hypothetical protein